MTEYAANFEKKALQKKANEFTHTRSVPHRFQPFRYVIYSYPCMKTTKLKHEQFIIIDLLKSSLKTGLCENKKAARNMQIGP